MNVHEQFHHMWADTVSQFLRSQACMVSINVKFSRIISLKDFISFWLVIYVSLRLKMKNYFLLEHIIDSIRL